MAYSSTASPPDYTEKDAAQLWAIPPPPAFIGRLPLPVAVPQQTAKYDSPFVRAYCPQLYDAGIPLDDWLKFLDGLNVAMIASPPLRVVGTAGMAIGMIPYHWCMIAGPLIQLGAQTGQHAISKTLTDRFLRRANTEFFGPRGLRVRLCKSAAMRQLIGMDATPAPGQGPSQAAQFAKSAGNMLENVALRLPVARRVVDRLHTPLARVDHTAGDVTTRRMAVIQSYVLPLDYNVPPARTPEGVMNQMSELAVKLDRSKQQKSQVKVDRKRILLAAVEGQATGPSGQQPAFLQQGLGRRDRRRAMRDEGLTRREQKSVKRTLRDDQKGRQSGRGLRSGVAIADRIEFNQTEALLWVVVLNADQDKSIEHADLADAPGDYENVNGEEWDDELDAEDETEEAYIRSDKEKGFMAGATGPTYLDTYTQ